MKKLLCLIAALCLFTGITFGQAVYHEVQFVDETGKTVTDISSIQIYNPDSTTNAVIYMDRAGGSAITQPILTGSANTTFTQSTGTVYWWGPDGYDFTFTNGTNTAVNAGHMTRTSSAGRLVFPSYLQTVNSSTYTDAQSITMGADSDFVFNAGTTDDRLTLTPATDGTSSIYLGTTGKSCDVAMWGDTSGYDLMWDASDNRLEFDDDAILSLGNSNDWVVVHSSGTTTATGAITHASAQTFSTDCLLTGNAYNVEWDNSSDTFHLLDNAELGIGGATTADGDVVFKHDGTTLTMTTIRTDEPWTIGGTTYGFDITYAFETAGQIRTDFDGDFINLTDDMDLRFGTGASADGDFMISSNSSNVLNVSQVVADTGTMTIGADDTDIPTTWYAETASDFVLFTGDDLQLEDVSLCLADATQLQFGDALGTGDIKIYATGTDLIIDGVVAETGTVAIGLTDLGIDFKLWAATSAEGVLWDASDEALEFTGANVTLDAASVLTLGQTVNADIVVTTGTYAVLAVNSGKIHIIPDLAGNTAINLPVEADGLYYKFIYCGAAADAHDHTIDSESNTNFFIGGVAFIDSDAGAGADELSVVYCDGDSNSEIVCVNLENGSVIELHCDGTNWYLTGTIYSDTTPTVADN